jgi:murein DD-endopeptidase MepM/ murein hydrolase activator NlpD
MKFLPLLGLSLCLAAPAVAQTEDKSVHVVAKEVSPGVVRIAAHSDTMLEYTLTLRADLVNLASEPSLPLTVDIRGRRSVDLAILSITDPEQPWEYSYHFTWRYGVRGGIPDPEVVYDLPYSPGEKHKLVQGYLGSFSHFKGSPNEYAYDFGMPVGTTVRAARGGVVTGVRQDSDVRGTTPAFMSCANYVIVRHSDGTYAEYVHLKKDGALVALGDTVAGGQAIGLSGNTGFSSAPHLHFAVFVPLDGESRKTLPIAMKTRESGAIPDKLTEGQIY